MQEKSRTPAPQEPDDLDGSSATPWARRAWFGACEAGVALRRVAQAPLGRTAGFLGSVIVSGVLCSALIGELTRDQRVEWERITHTTSFYLLLVYCFLVWRYNTFLYALDKQVRDFQDREFCAAYVRKECLPELTERYRKAIRDGSASADFKDLDALMKRLLK